MATDHREDFRAFPLDGALQFFHPSSGTHVRVRGPHTRALRRQSPRVVMFGITNQCNLACSFCSRDAERASHWTPDSAFETLRDLSAAGILEVAFGGGEPFVFPGFDELVARLHDATPLALHVTTNGTRLDRDMWHRYAHRFGQVRVSLYGDTVWRRCAELFASSDQRWGANLLVDDGSCHNLANTLKSLADAGCHDVSLLGYIGDRSRLLSPRARAHLSDIVLASPLPCRVSVCFGQELALPRLLAGFDNDGDCGAGSDFITVTPDQRVQSCSFQDQSFPGASAADVLLAWHRQRAALAQPSPRAGCARLQGEPHDPAPLPAIAIWQAFSGNNSGECVMVAKFETVADARAYLEELLPGGRPETDVYTHRHAGYSAAWQELFTRERVAGVSMNGGSRARPEDLVSVGKSVLATGSGLNDSFPELRALAWKRGAYVLAGGRIVFNDVAAFAAIGAHDDRDREHLVREIEAMGIAPHIHGRVVFFHFRDDWDDIKRLAGGRPLAGELFYQDWTGEDLVHGLQRLGDVIAQRSRLWIRFEAHRGGEAEAQRFAATLHDQKVVTAANWVLVDPVLGRKRVAVLALRRDGAVTPLDAEQIIVTGYFSRPKVSPPQDPKAEQPPGPRVDEVTKALATKTGHLGAITSVRRNENNHSISVVLSTAAPADALRALEATAHELSLSLVPGMSDPHPLHAMLRRLKADLELSGP